MRRRRSGRFDADGAFFVVRLLRDGIGGVERDLVDELAGVEPGDEDNPARHAVAPSGLDAGADRAAPRDHLHLGALVEAALPRIIGMHEAARSEEHTSELQSLMRISYAGFCLKKKNYITSNNTSLHN